MGGFCKQNNWLWYFRYLFLVRQINISNLLKIWKQLYFSPSSIKCVFIVKKLCLMLCENMTVFFLKCNLGLVWVVYISIKKNVYGDKWERTFLWREELWHMTLIRHKFSRQQKETLNIFCIDSKKYEFFPRFILSCK